MYWTKITDLGIIFSGEDTSSTDISLLHPHIMGIMLFQFYWATLYNGAFVSYFVKMTFICFCIQMLQLCMHKKVKCIVVWISDKFMFVSMNFANTPADKCKLKKKNTIMNEHWTGLRWDWHMGNQCQICHSAFIPFDTINRLKSIQTCLREWHPVSEWMNEWMNEWH